MPIFNKYKTNLYLIFENSIEYNYININFKKNVNYLYSHKLKIIRNFLFFLGFFLVCSPFSVFTYKNNAEFNLKLNINSLLFTYNNYNDFLK